MMGPALCLAALMLASTASDRDAVTRARQLYNLRQYEEAIKAADQARRLPGVADAASLILARAHLERFRATLDAADLTEARVALLGINPEKLSARDGVELVVGLGETLYFEGQFGAAAELFEVALTTSDRLDAGARDRLLDWWADSLSRRAAAPPLREATYARILRRMEAEVQRDARSMVAPYWLVVAARGAGDVDRAWDAAIAAWVRASRANPGAVDLRTDLDRYVTQVIIPERARRGTAAEEPARSSALRAEWDALKRRWISE